MTYVYIIIDHWEEVETPVSRRLLLLRHQHDHRHHHHLLKMTWYIMHASVQRLNIKDCGNKLLIRSIIAFSKYASKCLKTSSWKHFILWQMACYTLSSYIYTHIMFFFFFYFTSCDFYLYIKWNEFLFFWCTLLADVSCCMCCFACMFAVCLV